MSSFGASESPARALSSMMLGNPLLWEISPTVTLQSMWDSCSHTMTTSYTDDSPQSALSSCPSDSDASSQSARSPSAVVLRQLMATPSPGTAAAMVCTPPVRFSGKVVARLCRIDPGVLQYSVDVRTPLDSCRLSGHSLVTGLCRISPTEDMMTNHVMTNPVCI